MQQLHQKIYAPTEFSYSVCVSNKKLPVMPSVGKNGRKLLTHTKPRIKGKRKTKQGKKKREKKEKSYPAMASVARQSGEGIKTQMENKEGGGGREGRQYYHKVALTRRSADRIASSASFWRRRNMVEKNTSDTTCLFLYECTISTMHATGSRTAPRATRIASVSCSVACRTFDQTCAHIAGNKNEQIIV